MTARVLISINTAWNIFHFRAPLIRALKAAGFEVLSAAPADPYRERLRQMVDAHYDLPMDNAGTSPIRDLILLLRYGALLQKTKPAVLLAYTIKPNIYGTLAARFLRIPVINNVSGLGTAFLRDDWLTRVACELYKFAFQWSSIVFFQNPSDRDLFLARGLVAREKTRLIPGSGIDLERFKPMHASREINAPIRFCLIARLLRDKGVVEFVEAARRVKVQYPNTVFNLVGPTSVKNQTAIPLEEVQGWVKEGVVEYLGETEDAKSVIAAQDCIVLPSYREGMSRVLLEAAAMGKPLIASDVPGCHDVVTDAVNGFTCTVRDAAALAEAMLRFLSLTPEERTAMGRASRLKAENEFDEKIVFKAYIDAIMSVTHA